MVFVFLDWIGYNVVLFEFGKWLLYLYCFIVVVFLCFIIVNFYFNNLKRYININIIINISIECLYVFLNC